MTAPLSTSPTPSRTGRAPRRASSAIGIIAALVALVAAIVGFGPSAQAAGSASAGSAAADSRAAAKATSGSGWVRTAHLAPGSPAVDVQLTPFSRGRVVLVKAVRYGEVTSYQRIRSGLYTVAISPQGQSMSDPMISKTLRVTNDSAATVVVSGSQNDVQAETVPDDLTAPPAGKARIRLLSGTDDGAKTTATVSGGPVLARNVTAGSSTGYAAVPAHTWDVKVATTTSGSTSTVSDRVPLSAGDVYTLVVLQNATGTPRLKAVQDSRGVAAMPIGGIDTGGGWLAHRDGDVVSGSTGSGSLIEEIAVGVGIAVLIAGLITGLITGGGLAVRRAYRSAAR